MFLDLLCPDCAAAWPNIKQVTDYYAENITTTIHTFPLPYHNNGQHSARGDASTVCGSIQLLCAACNSLCHSSLCPQAS